MCFIQSQATVLSHALDTLQCFTCTSCLTEMILDLGQAFNNSCEVGRLIMGCSFKLKVHPIIKRPTSHELSCLIKGSTFRPFDYGL